MLFLFPVLLEAFREDLKQDPFYGRRGYRLAGRYAPSQECHPPRSFRFYQQDTYFPDRDPVRVSYTGKKERGIYGQDVRDAHV